MDHWFDDLARGLALGSLSRRDALKRTFQAALAAAGSFGRFDGLAQVAPGAAGTPQPPVRIENRGPCTIVRSGDQSIFHYSVQGKFNGKPLALDVTETFARPARIRAPLPLPGGGGRPPETAGRGAGAGPALSEHPSAHLPVAHGVPPGANLPLRASITATQTLSLGGDVVLHVDRTSFQGSTQVKVSYGSAVQGIKQSSFTTDGKVIEGDIDGRRIVPQPVGPNAGLFKFVDGGPAPS